MIVNYLILDTTCECPHCNYQHCNLQDVQTMIATYLSDDNDHIIEESDEEDDAERKSP